MKKLKNILTWITGGGFRRVFRKVLPVTTALLAIINSDAAIAITTVIPGEKDEAILAALAKALQTFNWLLEQAQKSDDIEKKKEAVGTVGAHMSQTLHGGSYGLGEYAAMFNAEFKANKAA